MEDKNFSNNLVDINTLPVYQEQQPKALTTRYFYANLASRFILSSLLLGMLFVIQEQSFIPLDKEPQGLLIALIFLLIPLLIIRLIWGYFADKAKGYVLRETDISFYSGLLFKKVVIQPFLRIQHIELKQGPIDRKLSLATIQVYSAGGALHTFEVPGLDKDKASALRQYILDHKDVSQYG